MRITYFMTKPILVLKPSIWNGLFPLWAKNLFYALPITIALGVIMFVLRFFAILEESLTFLSVSLIFLLLIISLTPLLFKILILYNTTYYFYHSHVTSEVELLNIRQHSVSYDQITDVSMHISLWDRLCNAGDITLHTGKEAEHPLVLHYIKNPKKIEHLLYKIIHAHTGESSLTKKQKT